MTLFRKAIWWVNRRRKENELRDELQFHLDEEAESRRADGLASDEATWAARRDLGNATLLRENTRALWTWTLLEQLAQDLLYAGRTMVKNRAFTALAALSLALGIGANTAIGSFVDAILLRSLLVSDPESLVVLNWRSRPVSRGTGNFVLHSINGSTYDDKTGVTAGIFPYPAFELLQKASDPVFSTIFAFYPAGRVNLLANGEASVSNGEYVSGDFFQGLNVRAAAGRLITADDDRAGASPVAVISSRLSERVFRGAANASGQTVLINNLLFTVVGVTPPEFFGVDPAAVPDVYLPMHANLLVEAGTLSATTPQAYVDQNYYWIEIMARRRPGVGLARAQASLAPSFQQWVAGTATTDRERENLPTLLLREGAGGVDRLRREYGKPLYVLWTMVALILAIACANTANLLLARAVARHREIAVRLSLGAGRLRVIRQLLTESVLLASLGGAIGVVVALGGIRLLTLLLANGRENFTLRAELNWQVLGATLVLSLLCGALFGLAPAIQSTRADVMPALKNVRVGEPRVGARSGLPRMLSSRLLPVSQIALSLLTLVAAGLFVRTLMNLQSIRLGFNPDNILLFDVDARRAGHVDPEISIFYGDLRRRLATIPGVHNASLSHASLIAAGRGHPILVSGTPTRGTRILFAGPGFLTTMQIPMRVGRDFGQRDRPGSPSVAVVSELFARTNFSDRDPIGQRLTLAPGRLKSRDMEVVGIAADARYGGLKGQPYPVVYIPYDQGQPPMDRMTYVLRTADDPLMYVQSARDVVRQADARIPVTNVRTQTAEIDRTITQEIVLAKLCSGFAILALIMACVGVYGTMAYAVARRTSEIGIRMALGSPRAAVLWLVLRDVCLMTALGLAISIPTALGLSRLIESLLFGMKPTDPRALTVAVVTLVGGALLAGYVPARRAARIDPMLALRHE